MTQEELKPSVIKTGGRTVIDCTELEITGPHGPVSVPYRSATAQPRRSIEVEEIALHTQVQAARLFTEFLESYSEFRRQASSALSTSEQVAEQSRNAELSESLDVSAVIGDLRVLTQDLAKIRAIQADLDRRLCPLLSAFGIDPDSLDRVEQVGDAAAD